MKCKNCGFEIDEKEKLEKCPNCNEKLEKDYGNPNMYLLAFVGVLILSFVYTFVFEINILLIGLYVSLVIISVAKSRFKNNTLVKSIFWIYIGFLIILTIAMIYAMFVCITFVGSCINSLESCPG